jgi:hypothetical protein
VCIAARLHGGTAKVERWNGEAWSTQAPYPNLSDEESTTLLRVSCTAPRACTTVGGSGGGSDVLAEGWNGLRWAVQAMPDGSNGGQSALNDISCSSRAFCVTVGVIDNFSGDVVGPLVERRS